MQCRFVVKDVKSGLGLLVISARFTVGIKVKKRNSRNVALLKFKSLAAIAIQRKKTKKPLANLIAI